MKNPTASRAVSWAGEPEPGDELAAIHQRAAETMGYRQDVDLFDARRDYERNYPGPHGPEHHLDMLIRRSEKQVQATIDLATKGGQK